MAFPVVHFATLNAAVIWDGYNLGFSEEGCTISIQPRWDDIYSDDMGGTRGVPSDSQFLGATGSVDLVFTKYDKINMDKIASFTSGTLASGNAFRGVYPILGSFARQDGMSGSLLIQAPRETLTFPTAVLRRNYEINSGTRYRRYVCGFELWLNQTDYNNIASAQTRRMYTQVDLVPSII